MEDKHIHAVMLAVVLLIAAAGVVVFFKTSPTGEYAVYPSIGGGYGGATEFPDPHTQFITFDEGVCRIYREQPQMFELWVMQKECRNLNPGRQARKGDCYHDALVRAATECRAYPVTTSLQLPQFLTGQITADPLQCASLAENYDVVIEQTAESSGASKQTVAIVNPCTGAAEAATRTVYTPGAPMPQYVRTAFAGNDVAGFISGDENGQGEVRYVRCNTGVAKVVVSNVPICDTMPSSNLAFQQTAFTVPITPNYG